MAQSSTRLPSRRTGDSRPAVNAPAPLDRLVEVRIDGLAPGGDAVGRQEGGEAAGRATFVPLAAPGERVRARLTREKARVAWGELDQILEPSAHRVTPPCAVFGRCGGCQWQHVDLGEQRRAKRQIVARALGVTPEQVRLVVPSVAGYGYRDRAELVVGSEGKLGFRERHSHDIVEVEACLLFSPALAHALAGIRASAQLLPPGTEIHLQAGRASAPSEETAGTPGRCPSPDSATMAKVHSALRWPPLGNNRESPAARAGRAEELWGIWQTVGIAGLRILGPIPELQFGDPDVELGAPEATDESPDTGSLRVPAGAFAQVGSSANAALISAVIDALGRHPGPTLELYAGSGNLTRALVRLSSSVVATDLDRGAVARGRQQVAAAKWVDRPPALVDADTVVVDPPREGLDAENLRAAVQARRTLVYVSCDPQTLGRDAAHLRSAGFVLDRAVALDLMPHTFHVEVVATFRRG